MKKYLLIPFLSLIFVGANTVSAQEKDEPKEEKSHCSKEHGSCCHEKDFCHSDYHCYRAWKKDVKKEKKLCIADQIEYYRPFAAERKRRKAEKKAWKRDILEAQHEAWGGWGHDYWY